MTPPRQRAADDDEDSSQYRGQERRQSKSVEWTGPLGKVKLLGYDLVPIMLIAIIVGLGYFLYLFREEQKDAFTELTYILLLPMEERNALKMQMPDSLRKKLSASNGR